MILPAIVRGRLLWSPANTGPLLLPRQVLTIHDLGSLDHPEWYDRAFAVWYKWFTPALIRRVSRVIAVSRFSKERIVALSGVSPSRVEVIPNGVSSTFYRRQQDEIRAVVRNLGIPTDRYVLSLGSIQPRKNLTTLLRAWTLATERIPSDVWLVVAGAAGRAGVYSNTNLDGVPQRVHTTGFVADEHLPALYSGAMALACVSLYEGFGLPVLEAMATGTVPIASDATSLPEVVGDAGLLVDPRDVNAIADSIVTLVQVRDLREKLGVRCRERSSQYTWERTLSRTATVLEAAEAS